MHDGDKATGITTAGSGDQWIQIDLGKRSYIVAVEIKTSDFESLFDTKVR